MKPPPPPPSPYRGAALAARVGPAAAGVRKGILTRVPGFGIRHLLRNRGHGASDAELKEEEEGGNMDSGVGKDGDESRNDLAEAAKRLLAEVGRSEYREEIVAAAATSPPEEDDEEAPAAAPATAAAAAAVKDLYEATVSLTAEDEEGLAPAEATEAPGRRETLPNAGAHPPEGDNVDGRESKSESESEGRDARKAVAEAAAATAAAVDAEGQGEGEGDGGARNLDGVEARAKASSRTGGRERHADEEPPEELPGNKEPSGDAVHTASRTDPAGAEEDAAAAATKTVRSGPSASTPAPPTETAVAGRDRSEEVRERRAEIKRRRAARREQQGALSPAERGVSTLLRPLRRFWGKGRDDTQKSVEASPEREDMIRRVCALSRPPPCDAAPC